VRFPRTASSRCWKRGPASRSSRGRWTPTGSIPT
jgi:hypothetical protein